MKTKIFAISTIIFFLVFSGCGKIKESAEKKVDEKVNKEIEKQKEEVSRQLQKADSITKTAGEQIDKEIKVKEALDEENILSDVNGQWAINADASTTYAGEKASKNASWSPNQMTGKPDVESYGDHGEAWASKDQDKGIEWIKLTYSKPVYATEVRVRQTYNPGAIIKVELYDDKGTSHTVWDGVDKIKYEPDKIKYFTATFDKTSYKTKAVKITLATNSVTGWNEIDAVQLVGTK